MKNFKLAFAGIAILIWAIMVIAGAEKTPSQSIPGAGSESKKNAPIIITQKQELLFYPYCSPFATAH